LEKKKSWQTSEGRGEITEAFKGGRGGGLGAREAPGPWRAFIRRRTRGWGGREKHEKLKSVGLGKGGRDSKRGEGLFWELENNPVEKGLDAL